MTKEVDVIVQARLDSERLPQKVVLSIGNKPLLAHIVERLALSKYIRNIIIATTEDSIEAIKNSLSRYDFLHYFVGNKKNVLERYFMAAKNFGSKIVIRATGDNPLVCPKFLDKALELHVEEQADLTHFLGIPLGTGVEIIGKEALSLCYKYAKSPYDQEHVTQFIYKNRDSFKVLEPLSSGLFYAPEIRVTVDTPDDMARVRGIFAHYHKKSFISMEDIVRFYQCEEEEEIITSYHCSAVPALA
jgi:spore coat polysaccharide biosynthesis protein SpsF